MKRYGRLFQVLWATVLCCAVLFSFGFTGKEDSFQIVSWNIKSGNDMLYRQERFFNNKDFDIAFLQEVAENTLRTRYKSCLDAFAGNRYEKAFTETVKMDVGSYGTGMLSRYPIQSVTTYPLPGAYGAEDRVMTRITVLIDGKEVALYNVHLSYESDVLRKEQIAYAAEIFRSDPVSYKILAGDFNVKSFEEYAPFSDFLMVNTEETPFETYRKEDWQSRFLDNVIYTDTLLAVKTEMIESDLSDHNPLCVTFVFAPQETDF